MNKYITIKYKYKYKYGDGEGGRNGYPSDSMKAALIRENYVVPSEDHDQMEEEASDSEEAPCPTSDSDDEANNTDGEGAGATFGAQRGAALGLLADTENTHRSSRRREDDVQHDGRGQRSTTFAVRRSAEKSQHGDHGKWSMTSSDVENFNINDKSDDDCVLCQLCEPKPVVERTQAKSTCTLKKTSSECARVRERSHDGRFKSSKASDSCSRQSYGRTNVKTSQTISKMERRTAGDELNRGSRAQRSDPRMNTNRRPMQILQHAERTSRADEQKEL